MKKFLAILLAMMLVLVSVSALADGDIEEEEEPTGGGTTTDPYNGLLDVNLQLPKSFEAENGTAPAQTFTFQFAGQSYTSPADLADGAEEPTSTSTDDIPAVGNVQVSFTKGDTETTKDVTVTLPMSSYQYGRYIYEVTEVIPETKTAGITYAEDKKMYMVVTVLSDLAGHPNDPAGTKHFVAVLHEDSTDGKKVDRLFENTYDAGSLKVSKELAGNMANLNDTFDFTIEFTAANGSEITAAQKAEIGITGGTDGAWSEEGLVYTVTLGHKDSITFTNIPEGTTYAVTEAAVDGYTETRDTAKADGKIDGGDEDELPVTNTLDIPVDTGVALDGAVYMLILALALAGIVALKVRRREEY